MGDRRAYLSAAVSRLSVLLGDMRQSRVFESRALLAADAPKAWDMPYLNMAVCGTSDLGVVTLLEEVKAIECDLGRQVRGVWAPREIDIDLLAMHDRVCETQELTIPHRELLNRDFALLPLVDVAPDWIYPKEGAYKGWKASDIARHKGYALSGTLIDTGKLAA